MTCALQHAPKIILICAVASALHQKKNMALNRYMVLYATKWIWHSLTVHVSLLQFVINLCDNFFFCFFVLDNLS